MTRVALELIQRLGTWTSIFLPYCHLPCQSDIVVWLVFAFTHLLWSRQTVLRLALPVQTTRQNVHISPAALTVEPAYSHIRNTLRKTLVWLRYALESVIGSLAPKVRSISEVYPHWLSFTALPCRGCVVPLLPSGVEELKTNREEVVVHEASIDGKETCSFCVWWISSKLQVVCFLAARSSGGESQEQNTCFNECLRC